MKKKEDENKKQNFRPQTCRNCGINGHLYKDCLHPIMSFGIICYKIEAKTIKYIMIQRKDTLSFMEFVRGKYSVDNIVYIKQLLSYMTDNEKQMLSNNTFDDVWNYTWCQNSHNGFKHTKEYIESKQKFDYINTKYILKNMILSSTVSNDNLLEQEWGFPKGRKKLKEADIDCAVREFCEETQLNKNDISICKEIVPFQEIFFGTNNILYKHVYYIAKLIKDGANVFLDNTCLEQIREVRALKWFTYDEVLSHIKHHNIERIEIFMKVHNIVCEIENISLL
jgi:8-oxo-dGTP pyrophosphatase MutT (NUDIX family)